MNSLRRCLWMAGAPARGALIGLIRLYRLTLSGMLGGQCRFHPSCSIYAEQAIARIGALRGIPLAAWRILRCSPLTLGGVDNPPVGPLYDGVVHAGRRSRPQGAGG